MEFKKKKKSHFKHQAKSDDLYDFLGRFHQKVNLDWLLWNRTLGKLGGMRDHELYFQESLHHRLNNPKSLQMWWRKTAPVQVLLRAELPFIKGFFMGFPLRLSNVNRLICSNAEDLRTSLNPTSIRGWCDTPPRLFGFPWWVQGKGDVVTTAQWGANRSDRPFIWHLKQIQKIFYFLFY